MLKTVDTILEQRRRRAGSKRSVASWVCSLLFHAGFAAAVWFVPELLAKPPAEFEYVPVMVVSPAVLGIEEPAPPAPRTPEPPIARRRLRSTLSRDLTRKAAAGMPCLAASWAAFTWASISA